MSFTDCKVAVSPFRPDLISLMSQLVYQVLAMVCCIGHINHPKSSALPASITLARPERAKKSFFERRCRPKQAGPS